MKRFMFIVLIFFGVTLYADESLQDIIDGICRANDDLEFLIEDYNNEIKAAKEFGVINLSKLEQDKQMIITMRSQQKERYADYKKITGKDFQKSLCTK